MQQETENFLVRRRQWLDQATYIIQKHDPLLSREQARRVAVISLRAWQDMRATFEWAEADEFINSL